MLRVYVRVYVRVRGTITYRARVGVEMSAEEMETDAVGEQDVATEEADAGVSEEQTEAMIESAQPQDFCLESIRALFLIKAHHIL